MEIHIDRERLAEVFLVEADESLQEMEEALIALEARPNDPELVQTIFRMAHTVKGGAGVLGYTGVAKFTHALEDLLERVRDKKLPVTSRLTDLLLQAVDVVRDLIAAAAGGDHALSAKHQAVLERIHSKSRRDPKGSGKDGGGGDSEAAVPDGAEQELSGAEAAGRPAQHEERRATDATTLRVGIDKLNRLLNVTSEILIGRGHVRSVIEKSVGQGGRELLEIHTQADHLHEELQELVMELRMVPLGPTFRQYIRTVRDLTAAHGKQARIVIEGENVEVDTAVIEHLRDPLTHMIRNAVDHGIERPAERKALGKDPTGLVTLRAYHRAGSVVVQVSDDGAGLNRNAIRERARRQGGFGETDNLSDRELLALVFEPGFTTTESVTELSGRGVGMDVVRRNIEALRGSVGLESRAGEGTTVTIQLPLTLAIIEGLSVGVMGETYVIPMDSVVECVDLPAGEQSNGSGQGVIHLRGEPLPYVRLRHLFRLEGAAPERENVVVIQHEGKLAGLAVDVLHGDAQAVIKPLEGTWKQSAGIAASTILGDGRVGLILDVPALMREVVAAEVV